jgi:hypothetical protein
VSSSEENLRITIKVCVTHMISDSLSLSLSWYCYRFCFWEMGLTAAAMVTGHGANSYYWPRIGLGEENWIPARSWRKRRGFPVDTGYVWAVINLEIGLFGGLIL